MAEDTTTGKTIYIIAGPTASGKSARALDLARQLGGVIVNCDSLQVYDGLPLLTAQPSAQDKQEIAHHFYGHLHPNAPCSAGSWAEVALPLLSQLLAEGKVPIIVGGTGLYLKALTEGLSPMPDIPAHVRDAAKAQYEALGPQEFYQQLAARDPVMAARFHPHHKARIIRAWEVLAFTGKSLSEWQALPRLSPPSDWVFVSEIIIPERSDLRARCDARFLNMLELGALEEVEAFAARIDRGEVRPDVPLTMALGYRELLAYIEGECSKSDAITRAQTRTKQYAKQQVTWFRNQMKATFCPK